MEMSGAYMAQTIEHLAAHGYAVITTKDSKVRGPLTVFDRVIYDCQKSDQAHFKLEVLCYPDGKESYYMELVKVGPIMTFSFPLDSWKFRPETVEFKYYVHPHTGLGLTFVLKLK